MAASSTFTMPSLTYYAPAPGTPNGTAVIVCAGGSYARLAMANEVAGITPHADARGRDGVRAEVSRSSDYGHPAPLQDVLRADSLGAIARGEFGVRPDRIGLFGASAGGHLAASAAALVRRAGGPHRRARSMRSARGRTSSRCCIRS